MNKFRKGDKVLVISGKDKGKSGVITQVIPSASKVVVEGVNICKKHVKPTEDDKQGGVVEIAKPVHWSNVVLSKGSTVIPRIRYEVLDNSKRRIDVKSKKDID